MDLLGIVVTIVVCIVVVPVMLFLSLMSVATAFPRLGRRMRIVWAWVMTRLFPGFWRWLEANNLDPVKRFYLWLNRDPAEVRGEINPSERSGEMDACVGAALPETRPGETSI